MTYPTKYNPSKEPLKNLFKLVTQKESYDNKDGELQPMTLKFRDKGQARYVRERLYSLFRAVARDYENENYFLPRPTITQEEGMLTFQWKEGKSGIEWKVVG